MANGIIGKVTAGGGTHLVTSTFYGTCTTAADVAAKIVKLADATPDSATLITGMLLAVKFTNANSVANPTLTVQRNANTTNLIAAKPIMVYGSTAAGTSSGIAWRAGAVILFIYDGTNWVITDYNDYSIHQNAAITTNGAFNILGGNSANVNEQIGSVNKLSGLTYNPNTHILTNNGSNGTGCYLQGNSTSYGRIFINAIGTAGTATTYTNPEDETQTVTGYTGNTTGIMLLELGNDKAVGTNGSDYSNPGTAGNANNAKGYIRMYGANQNYTQIEAQPNGNKTVFLPKHNGSMYLVHAGNNSAVGSATQPVYIAENGRATTTGKTLAYSVNAETTKATKWGIAYYSTANKITSTAAGTAGQVLQSAGNAAPTWITATNANTASTIVKRNANGDFSAGTITATLSGSASSLTTARAIDGVNFNGSAAITHYGTCTTNAGHAAKTVSITGFTLVTGAVAYVKFSNTNTNNSPTLNINSTGAKNIVDQYNVREDTSSGFPIRLIANKIYCFVYDGTNYVVTNIPTSMELYEKRDLTTSLNKAAIYGGAGAMFHLLASSKTTEGKPPTDANVLQMNWDNNGGYDSQIAVGTGGRMWYRAKASTGTSWNEVVTSTPGTATGSATLPVYINATGEPTTISSYEGNAATATKATQDADGNVITSTYATKTEMNGIIAAADAMVFKGVINANSGLPATHSVGWTYKIGTAGTYAGVTCEVGDLIICVTDGTAANNAHWAVVQNNVDGAVFKSTNTFTDGQVLIADGTNGKIKTSGYTIAKSVPSDAVFTDTVYTHPSHTAYSAGLYKVTVDALGHVTAATAVAKADITGLGIPDSDTDTKNTAGSTNSDSKLFLIGATSQAANPQTYSDSEVYTTNGTLTTKILSASAGINANAANSNTAGGVSLYGTNPAQYGITMRGTGTSSGQLGKHGYVQGNWAGYFCFDGVDTDRGYIFRYAGSNVASVSSLGNAVFNGSVTVGGNTTNDSGTRMEYNSTAQSLDFIFA